MVGWGGTHLYRYVSMAARIDAFVYVFADDLRVVLLQENEHLEGTEKRRQNRTTRWQV